MPKLTPPDVFSSRFPIFTHTEKETMEELNELFNKAREESEKLKEKPSNETLLQLYSLYKQATEGDITTDPPSNPFDFVAKAKFEARENLKGKSKQEAQLEYIQLVNKLKN